MSNCSCVYVGDPYDNFPEFINSKEITAKKEHKCCECGARIQPGDKYEVTSGKWHESGFHSFKTCMVCVAILDAFFCDGNSYGHMREDLWEHIQEHQGVISESCLADLSPGAREAVCDMIEDYYRDIEEVEYGQ